MSELFSNGGVAVVGAGGLGSSDTTLPTLYRIGMPATATFRIRIESEILKVTTGGQSSASWTVVRGQENTDSVEHAEGVPISQPLTAGAIADVLAGASGMTNPMTTPGDFIYGGTSGAPSRLAAASDGNVLTLASGVPAWGVAGAGAVSSGVIFSAPTPGAGNVGLLYLPTDASVAMVSTGSGYNFWGPYYPLVPVVSGDFSFQNDGTHMSIDSVTSDAELLNLAAHDTGENVRCWVKTITTGHSVLKACVQQMLDIVPSSVSEGGLVVADHTPGKLITFGVRWSAGVASLVIGHWTNYTTRDGTLGDLVYPIALPTPVFLMISDTGSGNTSFAWSVDGYRYSIIHQVDNHTFFPSSARDRGGFYLNYSAVGSFTPIPGAGIKILSFTNA